MTEEVHVMTEGAGVGQKERGSADNVVDRISGHP
jgi:hypothetical protein